MAMSDDESNIRLIKRLGDYGALTERLNELSRGNKTSSATILQIIGEINSAVSKLLEKSKGQNEQLEECKRNLKNTQRELEVARQRYEDAVKGATEASKTEIERATMERDAAIEAANAEKEKSIAAANAEKEESIRKLNAEKQQEQERLAAELSQKNEELGQLRASGQESSERAKQLELEKQKLSIAQQASQAALERDIRLKEEELKRKIQDVTSTYEKERADAARKASEEQIAAVEARGSKCQEELNEYKRKIQAELESSLQNQQRFLEELARVVPVQELQTIIERLNGLNRRLGGEGGAGAGTGTGEGEGGFLQGIGEMFGMGEGEQAPVASEQREINPAALKSRTEWERQNPQHVAVRGSRLPPKGGRSTKKRKPHKYTKKQRGGYQYGKTKTRTRTRSRSRSRSRPRPRTINRRTSQ